MKEGLYILMLALPRFILIIAIFLKNTSLDRGGAFYFNFGGIELQNSMIANNFAQSDGGAFYFSTSDDFIGNCIIANNKTNGQAAIV